MRKLAESTPGLSGRGHGHQPQGQLLPHSGTRVCTVTLVLSDLVTNRLHGEGSGIWLQNLTEALFLPVISSYTQDGRMPLAIGRDQSALWGPAQQTHKPPGHRLSMQPSERVSMSGLSIFH